ncbi:thioredoxin family protein [Flavobacterium sp. FlaQc-57]|uniref:thioredoxin family protein n=1 Tax=Flavobacterium sp. FlaQc-57 TaxID=3374186 RepID=UPI00375646A5
MTRKLLTVLFFLGSFFLHSQNLVWNTDLSDAFIMSDAQKKPLLIFITAANAGQKIQNEVFNTPDFAVWSRDNVILLKLDLSDASLTDEAKGKNVMMKNALGVEELPQVCLVMITIRKNKPTINKLGVLGYKLGGAKKWIADSNVILHPSND